MDNNINTKFVMDVVVGRTIGYLKEEAHLTTLITVGGNLNINVIFSFDENLIETIFAAYTKEIEIPPEEHLENLEETAGDVINIILGNATADFTTKGYIIPISPPMVIPAAKSVIRYKNAKFHGCILHTDHGDMSLLFMGIK